MGLLYNATQIIKGKKELRFLRKKTTLGLTCLSIMQLLCKMTEKQLTTFRKSIVKVSETKLLLSFGEIQLSIYFQMQIIYMI